MKRDPKQDDKKETCGAKKKNNKGTCKQPAGFRTDHSGKGRCYLHGGRSKGGPKKNMHGKKHGVSRRDMLVHYRPSMRKLMEQALAAIDNESETEFCRDRVRDEMAWCEAASAEAEKELAKAIVEFKGDSKFLSEIIATYESNQLRIRRRKERIHALYLDTLKTLEQLGLNEDKDDEPFGTGESAADGSHITEHRFEPGVNPTKILGEELPDAPSKS